MAAWSSHECQLSNYLGDCVYCDVWFGLLADNIIPLTVSWLSWQWLPWQWLPWQWMSCAYFCHEINFNTMSTVNGYVIYLYVGCLNSSEFWVIQLHDGRKVGTGLSLVPKPVWKIGEKGLAFTVCACTLLVHRAHMKLCMVCEMTAYIMWLWTMMHSYSCFVLYGERSERWSPSPFRRPSNPSAHSLNWAVNEGWSSHKI